MIFNRTLLPLGLSAILLIGLTSTTLADNADKYINHKGYLLSVKHSNKHPYVVYTNGKGMEYVLRVDGSHEKAYMVKTAANQVTLYISRSRKKLIKVMQVQIVNNDFILSARYADQHKDGFTVYPLPKNALQYFLKH